MLCVESSLDDFMLPVKKYLQLDERDKAVGFRDLCVKRRSVCNIDDGCVRDLTVSHTDTHERTPLNKQCSLFVFFAHVGKSIRSSGVVTLYLAPGSIVSPASTLRTGTIPVYLRTEKKKTPEACFGTTSPKA